MKSLALAVQQIQQCTLTHLIDCGSMKAYLSPEFLAHLTPYKELSFSRLERAVGSLLGGQLALNAHYTGTQPTDNATETITVKNGLPTDKTT